VAVAENRMLIGLDLTGLEVLQRSRAAQCPLELASALKPDLVILDVMVPILDGISATERIAAGQIAPAAVLTAFCQREDSSGTS
jgi:two-component system, response regulator PdtaR